MTTAAAAFPASGVDRRPAVPLAAILVATLFAFCHPYIGIRGDATIYIMRVLADLDPGGLGRDLMVVDDGQMRFSLFPLLLRPLVVVFGTANGALLISAIGSAAWLAALAALARQLAPARVALAMVAMVTVLPLTYGDNGIFSFAETTATPRPLAEAAVMAALAALLARRFLPAALALGFAVSIHPIMAAPGIGVAAFLLLCRLPMPLRVAVVVSASVAGLSAVALGLDGVVPFDRLVSRPDAAWLKILLLRSPHLFPTLWSSESFSPLAAQAVTVIIAARRSEAPQRRVLLGALAICVAGLAIEAVLGDELRLLLFIQTQAWRATWLLGVLAGCALALCTASLWGNGPRARIVWALLALAWFFQPSLYVTLAVAGLALALDMGACARLRLIDGHAVVAVTMAAILSVVWATGSAVGYVASFHDLLPGEAATTFDPLRNDLQSLPLCAAIAVWLVAPAAVFEGAAVTLALAAGCVILGVGDLLTWDQRSAAQAYLESPRVPPGLAEMARGRKPDVFWVDSKADAWLALHRAQYFSPQQAVSAVFSGELAHEWMRRANVLIGLGLAPRSVFTPWQATADDDREKVTQTAVDAFCERDDAPGLLVFPVEDGKPALRGMIDWRLPAPLFRQKSFVSGVEHRRVDGFGIVPCAAAGPASIRAKSALD